MAYFKINRWTIRAMARIVNDELVHIPRGSDPQNEMRKLYVVRRMKSLKKVRREKQFCVDAKTVLLDCLDDMKEKYPDFEPRYDEKCLEERVITRTMVVNIAEALKLSRANITRRSTHTLSKRV